MKPSEKKFSFKPVLKLDSVRDEDCCGLFYSEDRVSRKKSFCQPNHETTNGGRTHRCVFETRFTDRPAAGVKRLIGQGADATAFDTQIHWQTADVR